jgi:hypothetical protein
MERHGDGEAGLFITCMCVYIYIYIDSMCVCVCVCVCVCMCVCVCVGHPGDTWRGTAMAKQDFPALAPLAPHSRESRSGEYQNL